MSTLYSGLETDGMKQVRCTLKLQPEWTYTSDVMTLNPEQVTVIMDGSPSRKVQFHGCKTIQLTCSNMDEKRGTIMPPLMTVAGPCYYTKEDKKDFEIMMRTKEQSIMMKLPPNGQFDWPDYRAFETCPQCCVRAKPGSKDRFWLVYHPLLQMTDSNQIGVRMMSRLVCRDCFESITDECFLRVSTGPSTVEDVPLLDVIEDQGSVTWLFNGRRKSANTGELCIMSAYKLYQTWEYTGTWQALCNTFGNALETSSGGFGFIAQKPIYNSADPSTHWEMDQIPTKDGRKCDCKQCPNVHGKRAAPEPGKKKGKKIRLQECMGCLEIMYCSEDCQREDWLEHKEYCKEVQRKRKEEEEQKKAEQKLSDEAKMEAALASFVPLSITPQGGGSKKKKGKKGGGKKKKGKK